MKINPSFIMVVLLVTLPGISSSVSGEWPKYSIDSNLTYPTVICVADIDGDTDLDVAITSWETDDVFWYENGGDNLTWTKVTIDDGNAGHPIGVYMADIDGDTDLDVVAAGYDAGDVVWYENNLPNTNWTKHTIDVSLNGANWIYVADIDGDTDFDVAATGNLANDVVWYENSGEMPITWTKRTIDGNLDGARQMRVADLDGDADLDVIAAGGRADDVVWYENNLPDPDWPKHIIDDNLDGAICISIGDIDGDTDLDVAASGYLADDVVWYENNLPDPNWSKETIDADLNETRNVALADIDGDTDLDVLATSYAEDDVVWYENNLPDPNWPKETIDANLGGARAILTADIDDDTDLDVIATGQSAHDLVWYENPSPPQATAVVGDEGEKLPRVTLLQQNYPNPFNHHTVIRFALPGTGQVELVIFNLTGQQVATLVDGVWEAGAHTVRWDGRDDKGRELASGVYLYRLRTGDRQQVETRKLVLVR